MEPRPNLTRGPESTDELDALRLRLDPGDPDRLPDGWKARVRARKGRDHPLLLRGGRGFFLALGVYGWDRFAGVMLRTVDNPPSVSGFMVTVAERDHRAVRRELLDRMIRDA
jgi:hypothetical protein